MDLSFMKDEEREQGVSQGVIDWMDDDSTAEAAKSYIKQKRVEQGHPSNVDPDIPVLDEDGFVKMEKTSSPTKPKDNPLRGQIKAFTSDPLVRVIKGLYTDGVQKPTGAVADKVAPAIDYAARAVISGILDIADLPFVIGNGVRALAGEAPVTLPSQTDFAKRASLPGSPTYDTFVGQVVGDSVRFFTGGGLMANTFKLAKSAGPMSQSVKDDVIRGLAEFRPAVEAGISTGASLLSNITRQATDNPYAIFAAEFLGGSIGGKITDPTSLNAAEMRAGKELKERLANMEDIRETLEQNPGIPLEAAESLGLYSMFNNLARNNPELADNYHRYVLRRQQELQWEVEEALFRSELEMDEGLFQDELARRKDALLGMQDDIIEQAEANIREIEGFGGRSADDVAQSRKVYDEYHNADAAISGQSARNYELLEKAHQIQTPTKAIRDAAEEIVDQLGVTAELSSSLRNQLEIVLGYRLQKTAEGYSAETKKGEIVLREDSFSENMYPSDLIKARTGWLGAVRDIEAGVGGSTTESAAYIRLQRAALDAVSEAELPENVEYSRLYRAASEFHAKHKQLVNGGKLTPLVRKTGQGTVVSYPETFARELYAGDRFERAATSEDINRFLELEAQSVQGPTKTRDAYNDFLLSQGQRELKRGVQHAEEWLYDHQTMLRRHPTVEEQVRLGKEAVEKEMGIIQNSEKTKDAIGKDIFFRKTEKSPNSVINMILDTNEPAALTNRLYDELGGNVDAIEHFKQSVATRVLNKMFPASHSVVHSAAAEERALLDPLFKSKFFNKEERGAISSALNELERRVRATEAKQAAGQVVSLGQIEKLLGAVTGSFVVRKLTSGASSIILAGTGARVGQNVIDRMSALEARHLLSESLLDRSLFSRLSRVDDLAVEDQQRVLREIVSKYSPGFYSRIQAEDGEEQVEEQATPKKTMTNMRRVTEGS